MSSSEAIIKILGSAQDGGIPHANCYCNHCQRVYRDPELRRYATALGILLPNKQKWHLIDATPDFCEQLDLVRRAYPALGLMDCIFLSHAHVGHFTGLMYLGREIISTKGLPVYAGKQMNAAIRGSVPWRLLVELGNIELLPLANQQTVSLDELVNITPIEVPHRNEFSETFGFIIEGPSKKLLYIPDIDRWEQWNLDIKEVAAQMDYCLIDATFFSEEELTAKGRSYQEVPHPLLTHSMDLLQDVVEKNPVQVYFTHFNHTNPVADPNHAVHQLIQQRGFFTAKEGLEIHL